MKFVRATSGAARRRLVPFYSLGIGEGVIAIPLSQDKLRAAEALLDELRRSRASRSLLDFMRYCWWMPGPLHEGRHTRAICRRLTQAVFDYRRGVSTYLIITVPFRHGKSDIVSRALPAWFLGVNADRMPDVIMTGYGASLMAKFSRRAMAIVDSPRYRRVFPGVVIDKRTEANWNIEGSTGEVTAAGLGGSLTGSGGNLIVVDDYCKSRAEAVSETFRNKTWEAFRNDVFTRRNAPASIVCVTATPWHVDDLIGRIEQAEKSDPSFPRFERLTFPARKPGPGGWETLFPEHFPQEWYDSQRAVLGKQATALLDCAPVPEGGSRFAVDKVVWHDTLDGWPTLREMRAWDLASSSKQRDKDDPDRTWGVRGGVRTVKLPGNVAKRELWIRSMVCCREEAPERNRLIRDTALADGPGVPQAIEAFGAYKDAYTQFRAALAGASIVRKSEMPGDKSAKAAPLEPVFDGGAVHVYRPGCEGETEALWRNEFLTFPNGKHDDGVDATAILLHECTAGGSRMLL